MRVFLPDSVVDDGLSAPILSKDKLHITQSDGESNRNGTLVLKRMPSLEDMVSLLNTSSTFSQAAVVSFFSNLADFGLHGSMMLVRIIRQFCASGVVDPLILQELWSSDFLFSMQYYLKARFHFNKDQFADLMVISGIAGTISQLFLMPTLVPALGEAKLLSVGLLFSCAHMFLYSIAWSFWVPYVAAMFSVIFSLAHPCMRSIVSKQVGSCEQGMAQGCISGICSFAGVVSPLAFSPLTALFLSDRAPFNFPGFSIMCIGFAMMIAFVQSMMIRVAPPLISNGGGGCNHAEV